jgi:hypothetical protein
MLFVLVLLFLVLSCNWPCLTVVKHMNLLLILLLKYLSSVVRLLGGLIILHFRTKLTPRPESATVPQSAYYVRFCYEVLRSKQELMDLNIFPRSFFSDRKYVMNDI